MIGPGAFRFILAMAVFAHHASRLAIGSAAVYIFFALSGYWMHRMWVARYAQTKRPYVTYLVSRAWRLLPVFVLVGIVNILVLWTLRGSIGDVLGPSWWLSTVSGLIILGYAALPTQPLYPAWSLDIEMRYYLIAPAMSELGRRPRMIGVLLAAAGCMSLVTAALWEPRTGMLPYLIFFVLGLSVASTGREPGRRAAWVGLAAMVMLTSAVIALRPGALFGGASPGPDFAWNPAFNIAVALSLLSFALFTVRAHSGTGDRMLADLSYIVYLLHWPAVQWLTWLDKPPLERVPYLGLTIAVVLVAGYVIWLGFDRPINAMRSRWVAKRAVGSG